MIQGSNLLIEDYKLQSISVLFVYDLFKQLNLFTQNAGGDDANVLFMLPLIMLLLLSLVTLMMMPTVSHDYALLGIADNVAAINDNVMLSMICCCRRC